ncbi:MAG: addiction module protein [Thermoanaerobaculia bacterium]
MSPRILYREVETLTSYQATELADALLEGIEDDPEIKRLILEEVERRCSEYEGGKEEAIPGEVVLAELRAMLDSMEQQRAPEEPLVARPFEEIKREALELPDADREELAYHIFRNLEAAGFKIDWDTEADWESTRRPHLVKNEQI